MPSALRSMSACPKKQMVGRPRIVEADKRESCCLRDSCDRAEVPLVERDSEPRLEAGGGGGYRLKRGNGLDEAGDRQRVANASLAAHQMQAAALASQGDRQLHEGRDARTVDLRYVIQIHNHFAGALLNELLGELVQVLARFPDRQPPIHINMLDAADFARRYFQGWMQRHRISPQFAFQNRRAALRMRTGGPMHYTMKIMQDKSSGSGPSHRWKVTPVQARTIQEELRGKWEGEDRLGKVRTVAGLDASFVLTESQALSKPTGHWLRLREANRAIGCVVVYRFPEMEEIARAGAIVRLQFPYIPGLLSFREIPA